MGRVMVEGKSCGEGMRGSRERRHKRRWEITFLCHVIAKSGISVEFNKKRDMSCWRKREGLVLLLQRQRLQGNEKHSNWTFKRVIVTTGAGQHCTGERKIVNRMKAFLHYSKLGSIHMAEHTICSWENDGKKKQEEKKKERKNKQFSESGGKWHRLWHWLRYLVGCCNWFVFMFFLFSVNLQPK